MQSVDLMTSSCPSSASSRPRSRADGRRSAGRDDAASTAAPRHRAARRVSIPRARDVSVASLEMVGEFGGDGGGEVLKDVSLVAEPVRPVARRPSGARKTTITS